MVGSPGKAPEEGGCGDGEPSESSVLEDPPLQVPADVSGRSCTRSGAPFFIDTPITLSAAPRHGGAVPVSVVLAPTRLGSDGGPLSGELANKETVGGAAKPAECGGEGGFYK